MPRVSANRAKDPRLGDLLKVLETVLEVAGLTRRELARRLGSDYLLRRISEGEREFTVRQLLELADAVQLKPIELFRMAFDDDDANPSPLLQRLQEQSRRLTAVLGRVKTAPEPDAATAPAERNQERNEEEPTR
jgi:transcriptional regulator with XRE-family HTH domain